jgi:hypothetical protein
MHRVRLKVTDTVAYRSAGGFFRYGICLTKLTLHTRARARAQMMYVRGFQRRSSSLQGFSASARRITGLANYAANILVKASRP